MSGPVLGLGKKKPENIALEVPRSKRNLRDFLLPELWKKIASYLPDEAFMLRCVNKRFSKDFPPHPDMYRKICHIAAGQGWLNVLQWARKHGYEWDKETCSEAARGGHFEVLKWARANGCNWHIDTTLNAATAGHLEILQWAYKERCIIEESVHYMAAGANQLAVVKWLQEKEPTWIDLTDAAINGHLEMIQWVLKDRDEVFEQNICLNAVRGGQLHILKWAQTLGMKLTKELTRAAAYEGRLETLQWLRSVECPWDSDICRLAICKGNLPMLQWAVSAGCPMIKNPNLIFLAVEGCFDVIDWLYPDSLPPLPAGFGREAASRGHFPLLQWMKSRGLKFEPQVASAAANSGHFEIVKWLYQIGCEFELTITASAVNGGNFELLKWLLQLRFPLYPIKKLQPKTINNLPLLKYLHFRKAFSITAEILGLAAKKGLFHSLRWLLQASEVDCPKICAKAAVSGNFTMFKWLHAKGFPLTPSICDKACRGGSLEMVEWLVDKGFFPTKKGFDDATMMHNHVIDWLREKNLDKDGEEALST